MTVAGPSVAYRRPTEDDHRPVVDIVDEWAGGRKVHATLPRLWFRHFAATSWVAERQDGRLVGFLIGFLSPDRPAEAVLLGLAVHPSHRRHGIGRGLVERFVADATAGQAGEIISVVWPGNPALVAFLRAIGFVPEDGPGTQNRYGTASYPDYDAEHEDRAIFHRSLG